MWRTIPIYDNRYLINEEGRIYNHVTNREIFSFHIDKQGRMTVTLYVAPYKKHCFLLHRLLAQAFIPNPNNYPVVMHLDNNKLNLDLNNLKWGTHQENTKQAYDDCLIIIPKPDNRKNYTLHKSNAPVTITKLGLASIQEECQTGLTYNGIRRYVDNDIELKTGPYQGWKIDLTEKMNVQRSSPDGGVEPQA